MGGNTVTHEEIINDVRQNIEAIRSGHTRRGTSAIAFTTTEESHVKRVEDQVRTYLGNKYNLRLRSVPPSEVISTSGPAAPDFALEIQR